MKNLVATIKANKQVIIRRTLVVAGVAVGIAVASALVQQAASEEDLLIDLDIPTTDLS